MFEELLKRKIEEAVTNLLEGDILQKIHEARFIRRVRGGKVIRKALNTRGKNYRVVRRGNKVTFKRVTAQERRRKMIATRRAWRKGKASRLVKAKRTMKRSRIRMRSLYHK